MAAQPNKPEATQKRPNRVRPAGPRRRSRLRPLLFVLVLAAGVLLWFAPRIIARTPLRQRIVPALLPGYPAAITTGSAALDWFSPVELRDVDFDDLSGESLLSVPSIRSERTLIDIVLDSRNAGTIHLDAPRLRVVVRSDGSNLEDVVRPILAVGDKPSARGFVIESEGGDLELVDAGAGRRSHVGSLALSFTKPSDPTGSWQILCSGTVDRPGMPGTFRVEGSLGPPANADAAIVDAGSSDNTVLQARVRADGMLLEEFQGAVSRIWPSARCSGTIDADFELKGTLSNDGVPVSLTAEGRFASRELDLSASGAGGLQRWKLRDLAAGGRAEFAGGRLVLDDVRVKSDLARLNATGTFELGGSLGNAAALAMTASSGVANVSSALDNGSCRVQGEIDLTKLAQVFPNLVRVRDGMELTSGALRVNLAGKSDGARRTWDGIVEAKGIAAIAAGRSITWDQPVLVTFQAHNSAEGPVLDALDCKSDFLTASGHGSRADATVTVGCDLDRLAVELGRFLDLEGWRMAGKMRLELSCRSNEKSGIGGNGRVTIENFAFAAPGERAWSEKRLDVQFSAQAATKESRLERLESASLLLTSGGDRLDVKLLQPVSWLAESNAAEAPFSVELSGDLETWRARSQPLAPLADWDVRGSIQLKTRVAVSRDALRWEDGNATIDGFRAWGHGLFVSDPHVQVQTAGQWDRSGAGWKSSCTTWASNSLSLRADEVAFEKGHDGLGTVSGTIVFRGGVEQLSNWIRDPNVTPTHRVQGVVAGRLQLTQSNGISDGDVVLQFDDLVAFAPAAKPSTVGWAEAWREKQIVAKGHGRYDHQLDTLEIARVNLSSEALKFDARGAIGELSARPSFDLSGEIAYDWQNVIPRLRPWLGDDIQITGRQTKTFAFRGPRAIASARSSQTSAPAELAITGDGADSAVEKDEQSSGLNGEAGFGWASAKIYGLEIGPAELQARLSGTTLDISPLDLAVGDGRLKLAPQIQLLREPPVLVLAPGRVAENVRLSPEMCRNWLKYVTPLLADATRAEGRFSLDLAGAGIPLNDPKMGEVVGTLAIHQADVSPGPMARQVIQVAEQVRQVLNRRFPTSAASPTSSWIKLPEQNIEFRMAEGRVHHRLIEFQAGDVTIRTEGSVGFDETLALVATVPLRDEWVQNDKLLGGMKGQTLRIPITGTLKRPIVDSQALGGLARQMGGSAAGQLLKDGLGSQLDRLLSPRK